MRLASSGLVSTIEEGVRGGSIVSNKLYVSYGGGSYFCNPGLVECLVEEIWECEMIVLWVDQCPITADQERLVSFGDGYKYFVGLG